MKSTIAASVLLLCTTILFFACAGDDDDDDNDDSDDDSASADDTSSDDDTTSGDDTGSGDDTTPDDDTVMDEYQLLSSNGGGNFDAEYDEENCPPTDDCASNSASTLETPIFAVNGVIVGALIPETLAEGDIVDVLYAFADAECNLACGQLTYTYETPEEGTESIGSLPSNLPCSTADSNVYLGFSFTMNASGDYLYGLGVQDVCGSGTGLLEDSFTF
jgi:hypothetical protein